MNVFSVNYGVGKIIKLNIRMQCGRMIFPLPLLHTEWHRNNFVWKQLWYKNRDRDTLQIDLETMTLIRVHLLDFCKCLLLMPVQCCVHPLPLPAAKPNSRSITCPSKTKTPIPEKSLNLWWRSQRVPKERCHSGPREKQLSRPPNTVSIMPDRIELGGIGQMSHLTLGWVHEEINNAMQSLNCIYVLPTWTFSFCLCNTENYTTPTSSRFLNWTNIFTT
jgi:hypothetical protein